MMNRSTLVLVMAVAAVVCAAREPQVSLFQKYLHATPIYEHEQLVEEIPDEQIPMLEQSQMHPTNADCHSILNLQEKIACYKSVVGQGSQRSAEVGQMMGTDSRLGFFSRRRSKGRRKSKGPQKVVVNVKGKHAAAAGKALHKGKWHVPEKGNHIHASNQELNYATTSAKVERQAGAQSNIAATAQKVAARAAEVTLQKHAVVVKVRAVLEKAEAAWQVAKDNEAKASATAEEESERAAQITHAAEADARLAAAKEAAAEARQVKQPLVVLKPKADFAKKKRL
jgi:hypothetical protein